MSSNNSENRITNEDEKRKVAIAEDLPTLRSVMIGGALPAMPLRRTFHEPLVKNSGGLSSSAKLPPSVQLLQIPAREAPINEKNMELANDSSRWNVAAALDVPSYYDFERTHARVKGLSAVEVSKRIDDCLRANSIAASFDNEQAVARADCPKCVKFAVRLWNHQGEIVVEVQRSSGCSFIFQQIAKTILEAADPARVVKGFRAPPPLPRSLPPIPDAEWEANTCEGIQDATNAFKNSKRIDAHLLAIESLVHLSEGCKCKRACAEAVLQSEGPILPHVISLIQFTSEDSNSYTVETVALMHRHAVNLLANCLETIHAATGDIASTLDRLPELTSDEMLRALLREMDVNRPHDAAAACRCVTAMLASSCSDLKNRALLMGFQDAATAVSRCRHAVLEHESAKLQQTFL